MRRALGTIAPLLATGTGSPEAPTTTPKTSPTTTPTTPPWWAPAAQNNPQPCSGHVAV